MRGPTGFRMSEFATAIPIQALPVERGRLGWIAASTMIGSIIEWYDFYIYGTAAALIFNKLYFPSSNPTVANVAALLTFALGLFVRPIGAVLFGHFGDRVGRKSMLLVTLLMMGVPTVLIGLLPTYRTIGAWAPAALVGLRIVQGLAIGGEWGGAVLMAVEHAPKGRRALLGSMPQIGIPGGIVLSAGAFALASCLDEAEFTAWGWRLPFLASVVLVAFAFAVRWRIDESPEFLRARIEGRTHRVPIVATLREQWRSVLLAAGGKVGEVTFFFLTTVYLLSYATGRLAMQRPAVLAVVTVGALACCAVIPLAAVMADKVGPRALYRLGALLLAVVAVPMFMLVEQRSLPLLAVAVLLPFGLFFPMMFAPQPALYAAQFPPELRYTGMSLGVSLASAVAGGLAPIIATGLVAAYDTSIAVGVYLALAALVSAVSVSLMRAPVRGA